MVIVCRAAGMLVALQPELRELVLSMVNGPILCLWVCPCERPVPSALVLLHLLRLTEYLYTQRPKYSTYPPRYTLSPFRNAATRLSNGDVTCDLVALLRASQAHPVLHVLARPINTFNMRRARTIAVKAFFRRHYCAFPATRVLHDRGSIGRCFSGS